METRNRKRRRSPFPESTRLRKRKRDSVSKARPRVCLEDLPAEILEQILLESAELSLIHTSRRLHAVLPSYQRWAKGLLLVCFLQQERTNGSWNWHSANKAMRWTVPGLPTPLSDIQRMLLQRKVLNSHWLGFIPLVVVMHDLVHINVCDMIDNYDLSVANSMKINRFFGNVLSVATEGKFTMNAIRRGSHREYRITVPSVFVVEEYCAVNMSSYMRPVLDILHIPDKLLQPPFTDENIVLLVFLRRAWDPCLRMGGLLDFNRELLRSSILAIIRQEEPVENANKYMNRRAGTPIPRDFRLLILFLELEVTCLRNGYKQCIKDEYFEAAIFGGNFAALDALMMMDPCWPRKRKIRDMVKRNVAENPLEELPGEVARFVDEKRVESMRYKMAGWPPRKGRCGRARHRVTEIMFDIEGGVAEYQDGEED